MNRTPAIKCEEDTLVIRRLWSVLTAVSVAAAITAYGGTAAYALDECSGVTACVSVPDTVARNIPGSSGAQFDVYCPSGAAPYLWNWHVIVEKTSHPSNQTIISLAKVFQDDLGRDNGLSLSLENRDAKRSAKIRIKLGCSSSRFPYENAVRRTVMVIRSDQPAQ